MGLTTFAGSQPTLKEAVVAKNYQNEKELRAMGQLFINEEEAAAIRVIFDQYVHADTGANVLAKYLATHEIHKIQRQNEKIPYSMRR
mgnify:CR=1 FL=1